MSSRLANALRDKGVKRGNRVLLYMMNSVELVVSIFAVLKANAIYSIIDYSTHSDKLNFIANQCLATCLITHDYQTDLALQMLQQIPSLKFCILTGETSLGVDKQNEAVLSYEKIQVENSSDSIVQEMLDCDPALLLYTSGSTGDPKGVITTHRSSIFAIDIAVDYMRLDRNDIVTSPMPLSYSHGLNQMLKTFRVGGTLILEKSFAYPTQTLMMMEKERSTRFAGVPTMYAILLKLNLERYDLGSINALSSAGAVLPPSVIQEIRSRFPKATFYSIYGMAEASNALIMDPSQLDLRPTSVGKPFPGTEAWLVDENGTRLGPNQIGELVVRGGHVRSGYWQDAENSLIRFRPGLYPGELICFSGDMFQTDAEGFFYFVGRSDEIIKSGAKKVVPRAIENVLYSIDGVLEAAVIGVPDPILGQVPKAFVVLAPGFSPLLTEQDILDHCIQNLETYMIPRSIDIRSSLPKTPSGKVSKVGLA
jgi:acyl-coenzyme A synthetase/AMP-(fatty) acid ligase